MANFVLLAAAKLIQANALTLHYKAINRLHKLIDSRTQKPPSGQKKKPVQHTTNNQPKVRDDRLGELQNIRKGIEALVTAFNNVGKLSTRGVICRRPDMAHPTDLEEC